MQRAQRMDWQLTEQVDPVACDLWGAPGNSAPVLLLRGFDLASDWGFYSYLAQRIAEFRPVLVPLWPTASLVGELDGIERLLRAWRQGVRPAGFEGALGAIGLLGHGKGAALAILAAARNLGVRGVVGLGALCTLNRGADDGIRRELAEAPHRFLIEPAARGAPVPVLLVHGEEDHIAPIDEAEMLYHWLPKESGRLVMLEKTGHSFGAADPFAGTTKELDIAVQVTCDFFR